MNQQFFAAGVDDIEQVLQMQEAFYAVEAYEFDRVAAAEALRSFLDTSTFGKLWLIVVNGQTAGYAALTLGFSFEYKGRDAFLDELFLMPEYRGHDIGARAVEFIVEQASLMGVKAIHLEVELKNDSGISLYRRYGFEEHNRMLMTRRV